MQSRQKVIDYLDKIFCNGMLGVIAPKFKQDKFIGQTKSRK